MKAKIPKPLTPAQIDALEMAANRNSWFFFDRRTKSIKCVVQQSTIKALEARGYIVDLRRRRQGVRVTDAGRCVLCGIRSARLAEGGSDE